MKIGIDLGTSYSSIAAEINGKIEMIKVSTGASAFGDSFSMPTAIYVDNGNILLGQAALGKRKMSPQCFKNEFKRDFGTTTPYILSGEEYLPEQLYTEVLLYFKEQAVKQMGEKVERVYLTHPANYGNNKKRLLEKAANNAGLFDVVLVDEPTAAATGYSQKNKINDGDILLVYDLGGGTFDVALIKKTEKGYVHLAEPLGISQCGGIDFDRVIFEDIIRKMEEKSEFDTERLLKEKRFTAALSEICIQIKHQLTQSESHTEPIPVGFDYFEYTITRQEFEDMIKPLVTNTCEKVKDILMNSGLVAGDIDRVLLVGGSTRVPLVQKMVCDALKKEVCFDADPELAVCQGAVSIEKLNRKAEEEKKEEEKKPEKKEAEEKVKTEEEKKAFDKEVSELYELIQELNKSIDNRGIADQDIQLSKDSTRLTAKEAATVPENVRKYMLGAKAGYYPSDNEWIYCSDKDDNNCLYKISRDGSKKIKLLNEGVSSIKLKDEWVYYILISSSVLCRMKKDGTENSKVLQKSVSWYIFDGEMIYLVAGNILRKMHTDGTGNNIVILDNPVHAIAVDGDWIYYVADKFVRNLYKIRKDGKGRTKIAPCNACDIVIAGDWVYYRDYYPRTTLNKMRIDGTGSSRVYGYEITGYMRVMDGWLYIGDEYCNNYYRMRFDGTSVESLK